MANRNLADEVDALAKGLASLRAANKRTVSRVAALEDRELESLEWLAREGRPPLTSEKLAAIKETAKLWASAPKATAGPRTADIETLQAKERWDLSKYPPIKLSGKLFDPIPPSFWQRIRAWWAR